LSASDDVNRQRFTGMRWDKNLPLVEAAKNAGAPMAWQQLAVRRSCRAGRTEVQL
jgi:hypothetical protein